MYIKAGHLGRMGARQQCWSLWCSGDEQQMAFGVWVPCLGGDGEVLLCASCPTHLGSHGAAQPNPNVF